MKNGKTFERAVRAIQEWKIRAGQNPLSYDFQCERTACVESTLDVVRAMLPYHTQWKHVAGTLPGLAWVWILSTIAQSAPLLEYLEVIPHGGYQTYATVNISLSSVPRLRYLSIPLNNVRLVPGVTNLHGIRTLQFTGGAMSVEDCMSCLAHCPNLEICRMTCADQLRYNGRGVGNVIEATHLTHFHLTAQHDAAACFDRLYAPVLIDLEILITARPYPGTSSRWTHVRSFLERSKSPLQSLVVDNPLMGEDDLIDCLRLVPHLTSLWIRSGSSLTDRGIGFLTLSPYNDICQDLQTLTVSAGERVCSLRSMESLILSRWPGRRANLMNDTEHPSPMWKRELRKICLIGFAFFIYSFELPSIQECIDEGFRLTNYL
ncbi:hypothetical protein BD410DRAFT_787593 [Rickenella mellea]|uniref:F-box domain-containing protein n=1 Tax=Rickenella mellea TaxID=50990 RepID=A0A4Y7Q6I7_9AGAM|nr:hypothetical protein BD410DRAFT_787593 [Rickenella mellea]